MKLLKLITLSITSIIVFSGCQTTPLAPKKPQIDSTLPTVTQIKSLSDMTEVGFEWKANYDERVAGYYVYRSNPKVTSTKLQRIATVKDRYSTHFVDTKLTPETKYYYRFSTYSKEGRESVPSEMITVDTQKMIPSVAFIQAIVGLPNRVKVIWRPQEYPSVESYIIERNDLSSPEWKQIAEVKGRLSAEYIDAGLKDNYLYRYRIKVKTCNGIISHPSQIVEAHTKPLPPMVENLRATNNAPKKIVLSWDASTIPDFSYYKVYRTINPILFYSYYAKTKDNKFEDLINDNGKTYYYKVTAVDKDVLESLRQDSPVAGSTLGIPEEVSITSAKQDGKSIMLTWASYDNRAASYNIIKEYGSKKVNLTGITSFSYQDHDVIPGVDYKYSVVELDKYGLESKPSESIVVTIPKDQ
ncbi:fibronectin type III domain-containing protein [Sulfurospirillum sp. 1612]|uniref:fibronectin type III domain-containing protein n=1 Tax=Sulfurospirillum sp. 1612 TaxID=3094835 RepID=UPI002F94B9C7